MNTGKKHVPLLRFPTFRQDGEWGNVKLGDYLLQTPDYGLNAPAVPYSESLPTYLRITDITDSGKFDKSHLASVNAVITPENSLQEGDLVVARTGASVGKVYKYRKEDGLLVFAGFLIRLRPNPNRCNSEYLFQYMLSPTYKRWVDITSTRSGQPGINSTEYASLTVPFPQKLLEQQKIADCLSSIDLYISSINEKVGQLKAHKTSLLQKLFPQRGQTVPEYRFSEFEKDRAWEKMKLGDVTIVVNRRNKSNRSLPIYSISNKDGFILQSEQFDGLDSESRGYDISLYKIVGRNTFAYNPARINIGSIGYSGDLKEVLISSLYVCFKTTDELDDEFLICFLKTAQFNQAVENNVEGGIRSYLFYENFSRIKICLPSLLEQKKIASTILSIDEVISKYTDKVSLLEDYKKGLMQQLFPTITK